MQRPGLVLKRPNPAVDSGGYRALFVFDLAERLYQLPGLKRRVLGDDHNEAQYFDRTKEFPLIRDGRIDVFLTYITNALLEGFPFLDLPEEIDQSNPSMQRWYETASYTNPRGQTFRGAYAAYAVTIPVAAASFRSASPWRHATMRDPIRPAAPATTTSVMTVTTSRGRTTRGSRAASGGSHRPCGTSAAGTPAPACRPSPSLP